MTVMLISFVKLLLGFAIVGGSLWVLWQLGLRWRPTRPVLLVGGNTVTGVLRGVVLNVLVLLAAMAIIALIWPSDADNPVEQRRMLVDSGLAGITVMAALIAIFTGFTLIPGEIDTRTAYPVLSKPVRRWQFVLGKYMGAVAVNAITLGLLSLLFFVLFIIRQKGQFDPRLAVAVGMAFWQLAVLSALIIFLSTFMSWIGTIIVSMVAWFLGSYAIYIWDFMEMRRDQGANWMATVAFQVVQRLFPNFQAMDLRMAIMNSSSTSLASLSADQVFWPLANASLYLIVALALSVLVFNYREV